MDKYSFKVGGGRRSGLETGLIIILEASLYPAGPEITVLLHSIFNIMKLQIMDLT